MNVGNVSRSNPMTNSFRANTQNNINQATQRLASGRRINTAADDAAGLAIATALEAQIRSLGRGADNVRDMGNLTRVAEGGLGAITENLMRVRELTLQAANPIMGPAEHRSIQTEIDQNLRQIQNVAVNTEFNTIRLLDGNFADRHVAANPDGSGMQITIQNATLEHLGLGNIDVTGGVENLASNLAAIDNALSMVVGARGEIGATQNRFDFNIQANEIAQVNLAAARSRIADADMALETKRLEQARVMQQYQIFAMRSQMQRERENIGFVGISWQAQ